MLLDLHEFEHFMAEPPMRDCDLARRCKLLVVLSLAMLVPSRLLAQAPPPMQEPEAIEFEAESPELLAAMDDLREHLKLMREVLIRFNVGDDSEDRKWRQKWNELKKAGVPLHRAMLSAALAEYLSAPENKRKIGDMLYKILRRNMEADRYEGMLDIAKALLDTNYPGEDLIGYIGMSSFAMNDFETARPYVARMIEEGYVSEQLLRLKSQLGQIEEDWKEEQAALERDAAGEPLPRVLITTTKGLIEIELFENEAPETVGNFIHLVEQGFYEHLEFHRVLTSYMAQGGCPNGDGTGGPGYTIRGEMNEPGARNFFRGTLGIALANNDPDTGGSQFFIAFLPLPDLNGNYTAFARVVEGMDVVASLTRVNPEEKKDEKSGEEVQPPDEILEMEVLRKRDHEYKPTKVGEE